MTLFGFGSNGSGQLGIGTLDDTSKPQICQFVVGAQAIQPSGFPIKITAGGNTTYILFNNGDLYKSGRSLYFPAVEQPFSSQVFQRLNFQDDTKIRLCSSFWDGAVFVNANNEVFVEGSGPAGELGLGQEIRHCKTPRKLDAFSPPGLEIIDIASCVSHTVVVLSNGEAWGWGNGRKGQLGEPAGVIWEPRKIEGIGHPVVRLACGREFTFLIGDPTAGAYSLFGSDKWSIKSSAPTEPLQGWKDIGASWGSLFVLNTNGRLRNWGRHDRGQLSSPKLPIVIQLAVGSEHVLALTEGGEVVAWGWGEHGNCGSRTDLEGNVALGAWNTIVTDHQDFADGALSIGAGCATSFIWKA